jgi:hypothetical protein
MGIQMALIPNISDNKGQEKNATMWHFFLPVFLACQQTYFESIGRWDIAVATVVGKRSLSFKLKDFPRS